MCVITIVSDRDIAPIPFRPFAAFVAGDKQDRTTLWVEDEENAEFCRAYIPGTELFYVLVTRSLYRIDQWATKRRALFFENVQCGGDPFHGNGIEAFDPHFDEFRFDIPNRHNHTPCRLYNTRAIVSCY